MVVLVFFEMILLYFRYSGRVEDVSEQGIAVRYDDGCNPYVIYFVWNDIYLAW